jgi:hypothetical protein
MKMLRFYIDGMDRRDGYEVVSEYAPDAETALEQAKRRYRGTRFVPEKVISSGQ